MKTENKHTLMVWSIVVLVVLNVSTIATVVYHHYQSEKPLPAKPNASNQLESDTEKFSGRYFRDKLNLNSSQMGKFREFNPVFRHEARSITLNLAVKRSEMLVEMAASNSDTLRLIALSDSIGILHSNLKKITYKYYLNLKSICNEEQQKDLKKMFGEMFTIDQLMGFPGKGMHRGGQKMKQIME